MNLTQLSSQSYQQYQRSLRLQLHLIRNSLSPINPLISTSYKICKIYTIKAIYISDSLNLNYMLSHINHRIPISTITVKTHTIKAIYTHQIYLIHMLSHTNQINTDKYHNSQWVTASPNLNKFILDTDYTLHKKCIYSKWEQK